MPNHRTHETVNLTVLTAGLVFLNSHVDILTTLWFVSGFLICTFFITPDIDINSKPYHRWRKIRLIWWPYKRIFKHRGISHHVIGGPVSLIGYSMAIPLMIIPITWLTCAVIIGMFTAIELHILVDKVFI